MNTGMGGMAAVLSVLVQAKGISDTNRKLMTTHGALKATEGAAVRMGKQLATAAKYGALAAAVGIGVAVKKAIDFDKAMRNVNSIAQLNEKAFGRVRDKVLELAGPTAQAPKTLAAGLYDLVSSGFDAQESLKILAKSARAATAGLTTTEISTAAVAAVLNAYHLAAGQAGDVSDVLFQIVNRGVISFESLASEIGDVLPFSASLGVSLREVGASIATMTKSGISGPETMTRIKAVMVSMLKPSKDLSTVIKEQGYESGEAMIKTLGFQGTLDSLFTAVDGSKTALAALFPNIRALGGALALTGENSRGASEDLKGMQDASGATAKALSQQSKSIAYQWQQLTATAEVLAIEFGSKLLPAIGDVIDVITDPKITTQEKISKVFDLISSKALEGFTDVVNLAGQMAPEIIGALALGMLHAWVQMNPLAKLFTVGALVRVLGGKGAITATGATIGRWLGIGIGAGASSQIAATLGADALLAGGAGAALGRAPLTEADRVAIAGGGARISSSAAAAEGAVTGKAAAGGVAGGLMSGLKAVKWGRIGALGIGLALADSLSESIDRGIRENSADLGEALSAKTEGIKIPIAADLTEMLGIKLPKISMDALGIEASVEQSRELEGIYKSMLETRVQFNPIQLRDIEGQARSLDLTEKQRDGVNRMLRTLREGSKLHIGVDASTDPHKLELLGRGFQLLRSGALTSMHDISKVVSQNMDQITASTDAGSRDAREKMAENYRDAAHAIAIAMGNGSISVKKGLADAKALFRNAKLITGEDPFGIAKGFRESWKQAGEINSAQRQHAIEDLGKMLPAARQKAFDSMIAYGRGLVAGGKVPKQDLKDFRSAALAQFDELKTKSSLSSGEMAVAVANNFGSMGSAASTVLEILMQNTNGSLAAFGAKPLTFAIKAIRGWLSGGKDQKKQAGGNIVPGSGSGDTFRTALPPGSFVENREAVKSLPFARGGVTPVALEPGERVYLPPEVKALGRRNLEARNAAVPRFQKGGMHGKPQIAGPAGPLLNVGQGAVDKAYAASQAYLDKHRPKPTTAGGGTSYSGPPPGMEQLANNAWVDSHTLAVANYVASKFGFSVTSGYRSPGHNAEIGGASGSHHMRGTAANPGAADISYPGANEAGLVGVREYMAKHVAGIVEGPLIDNMAGWNMHTGFFAKGGLIQELAAGGRAGEKVGASSIESHEWLERKSLMRQLARYSPTWNSLSESPGLMHAVKGWNDLPDRFREFNGVATARWLENKLPAPWSVDKDIGIDPWESNATYAQAGGLIRKLSEGGVVHTAGPILLRNGLDSVSAAGVLGNSYGESSDDPASVGSGGKGLWGFTASPVSPADLDAYAASQGKPWTDIETQTQFMLHHFPSGLKSQMNAASSVEDTTSQFMHEWENPENYSSLPTRIEAAQRALKMLGGKGGELTAGQTKAAEGKARKANYEKRLAVLRGEVAEAKTIPAQQAKLWRLMKFWGRVGIFDKDEHSHVIEAVQNAASQTKPEGAVKVLGHLASYAREHGEITGQDPSNFRDLEKAIERAQERGQEHRKKAVERQRKHVAAVHARVAGKIANRAAFPEWVTQLEGLRGGADTQEEFMTQLVGLEPENLGDSYVGMENAGYGDELNRLLAWRNKTIAAQNFASAEIGRFEKQIADIEALNIGVGQGNPAKGKMLGGLLEHFARGGNSGLGQGHKVGAKSNGQTPSNTFDAYKKQQYKIPLLEEAITNAKTMRDETWTGELEEIQGSFGGHEALASLPSEPGGAGAFGGRIFEIQNSIRELGLKVGPASDTSEQVDLLKELLKQANQRALVSDSQRAVGEQFNATYPVNPTKFAGMFATGGDIPAGMWGIAGERGPEPVMGPARVVSNQDAQDMFGGADKVELIVNGDIVQAPGDTRDPFEVLVNDERFPLEVQKHASRGRGKGRRTPGGGGR